MLIYYITEKQPIFHEDQTVVFLDHAKRRQEKPGCSRKDATRLVCCMNSSPKFTLCGWQFLASNWPKLFNKKNAFHAGPEMSRKSVTAMTVGLVTSPIVPQIWCSFDHVGCSKAQAVFQKASDLWTKWIWASEKFSLRRLPSFMPIFWESIHPIVGRLNRAVQLRRTAGLVAWGQISMWFTMWHKKWHIKTCWKSQSPLTWVTLL